MRFHLIIIHLHLMLLGITGSQYIHLRGRVIFNGFIYQIKQRSYPADLNQFKINLFQDVYLQRILTAPISRHV